MDGVKLCLFWAAASLVMVLGHHWLRTRRAGE